jgi:hypothetical protein
MVNETVTAAVTSSGSNCRFTNLLIMKPLMAFPNLFTNNMERNNVYINAVRDMRIIPIRLK